jgi:hypothetical protein
MLLSGSSSQVGKGEPLGQHASVTAPEQGAAKPCSDRQPGWPHCLGSSAHHAVEHMAAPVHEERERRLLQACCRCVCMLLLAHLCRCKHQGRSHVSLPWCTCTRVKQKFLNTYFKCSSISFRNVCTSLYSIECAPGSFLSWLALHHFLPFACFFDQNVWTRKGRGRVHFPLPTQNISSYTHHIKSFDACMEH